MKVLITGMAGFIGSNLAMHLVRNGASVVGVDNFTANYPVGLKKANLKAVMRSGNAEFIEADITDKFAFNKLEGKGITHVVHLAARAGVRDSTEQPEEFLRTNIIGTLNVLEFSKKAGVKKAVLASTSSVYAGNPLPYHEEMPLLAPMSIYGASKIGMESVAHAFHNLHGLPIIQLRFFTVYGPGGRPDMAVYKFTEAISAGKEIQLFGGGGSKRDFTYVGDICDGILLALKSSEKYGVFNLGNSDSRSVNDVVSLIEKSVGKKAKSKAVGKNSADPDATLADISKARDVLGYTPKVRLEEGIPKFVEWFLNYSSKK